MISQLIAKRPIYPLTKHWKLIRLCLFIMVLYHHTLKYLFSFLHIISGIYSLFVWKLNIFSLKSYIETVITDRLSPPFYHFIYLFHKSILGFFLCFQSILSFFLPLIVCLLNVFCLSAFKIKCSWIYVSQFRCCFLK